MVYSFSKRQRKGGSIRRPIRSQKSKGTVAADVVGVTLPDAETQAAVLRPRPPVDEIQIQKAAEFAAEAARYTTPIKLFLKRARASQRRINKDPLKWLLEWSQRDAASLWWPWPQESAGDRREDPSATDTAGTEMLAFLVRDRRLEESFEVDSPKKAERLTPDEINECREEVRHGIAALTAGRAWWIPPSSLRRGVVREPPGFVYLGVAIDCFLAAASHLVATEASRLRRCARPECGRVFVRSGRRLFCSTKCGNDQHLVDWRKNHAIFIENRWFSLESDEAYREYRHRKYEAKAGGTEPPQLRNLRGKVLKGS